MRCILALAFFAWSSAACADLLGLVDYDTLFSAHENEVIRDEDGHEVLIIGVVRLDRYPDGRVISLDRSNAGAVGCITGIFGALDATVRMCPDLLTPNEQDRLVSIRERLLSFYRQNVGRPVSAEEVQEAYEARALRRFPDACSNPDILRLIYQMIRDADSVGFIDIFLEQPRLSAGNPCL